MHREKVRNWAKEKEKERFGKGEAGGGEEKRAETLIKTDIKWNKMWKMGYEREGTH